MFLCAHVRALWCKCVCVWCACVCVSTCMHACIYERMHAFMLCVRVCVCASVPACFVRTRMMNPCARGRVCGAHAPNHADRRTGSVTCRHTHVGLRMRVVACVCVCVRICLRVCVCVCACERDVRGGVMCACMCLGVGCVFTHVYT